MSTLLSTKLHAPRPHRALVHRQRLLDRLDAGLRSQGGSQESPGFLESRFARKMTLVSAPAGYGKTTLVSDWIARSQAPAAWLSLDASDNDPPRFFSYVIAGLQQIDPEIGIDIRPILETGADLAIEPVLAALVNDIALSASAPSNRIALVLDDYHEIQDIRIHQGLDFLLDHVPPGMHMVIISRADPPIPLGRLRVQRELTEIREADLRFTLEEATTFLNELMGLALPAEDIESLDARTEGWVAGLQLAALSLQGRSDKRAVIATFSGSHRHLIDYLIHEVMSRQPERVRTFLLRSSILERFTASLCDVLTGETDAREMLLALEASDLFLIPLDDERQWYRYHQLFGDFLKQLLRETEPEIIPELFVRASDWYEAHGMVDEAIECALAGDDSLRAARLLDGNVETLFLLNAEVSKLLRWAGRLPLDARARFPRLCIYHAWALQFEFQLEAVEPVLALAEAHLSASGKAAEGFSASDIVGFANAARSFAVRQAGDVHLALHLSQAGLQALPAGDNRRNVLIVRGVLTLNLGMAYLALGQLDTARACLESGLELNLRADSRYAALGSIETLVQVDIARGALRQALANGEKGLVWVDEWSRAQALGRRPVRMLAHLRHRMGGVQYEMNDLAQAAVCLSQACKFYELVESRYRVNGYLLLVDLHQALGEVEIALGYLQRLKRISLTPGFSAPDMPLAALIAERSLRLSQLRSDLADLSDDAAHWAETSGLAPSDDFSYEQEVEYRTLARVLTAEGEAEKAIPLLDHLIASAETAGRNGDLIAYLSVQAIAHHAQEQTDAALAHLSRALALGETGGYIRTFVDLGPAMCELLHIAAERNMAPAYVTRLIAGFPATDPVCEPLPAEATGGAATQGLVEPLTEREIQILRLLTARLSYREIAQELYLSLNTIKWYAKSIYGKLGVSKRDQAATRARELGLL